MITRFFLCAAPLPEVAVVFAPTSEATLLHPHPLTLLQQPPATHPPPPAAATAPLLPRVLGAHALKPVSVPILRRIPAPTSPAASPAPFSPLSPAKTKDSAPSVRLLFPGRRVRCLCSLCRAVVWSADTRARSRGLQPHRRCCLCSLCTASLRPSRTTRRMSKFWRPSLFISRSGGPAVVVTRRMLHGMRRSAPCVGL